MICHKVRDKSWSCYKVGTSLGDGTRLGQVLELLQGWGKSWRWDKVGTSLGDVPKLVQGSVRGCMWKWRLKYEMVVASYGWMETQVCVEDACGKLLQLVKVSV